MKKSDLKRALAFWNTTPQGTSRMGEECFNIIHHAASLYLKKMPVKKRKKS